MSISTVDLTFYIYETIIFCGFIFRVCLGFEDEPVPKTSIPPKTIYTELLSKKKTTKILPIRKSPESKKEYLDFFNETLNWCEKNVKLGENRKIRPCITVSFCKKVDVLGYYEVHNKKIMMYVLKHESLRENVKTFIHEYVHHLQLRNSNDNVRYHSLTKKKGYYSNDYEIEARELSRYYLNDCCRFLNVK
jgi:hypothetical protein